MIFSPVLAVTDVVWQALIGACVTIVLAWFGNRTKKEVVKNREVQADNAASCDTKLNTIQAQGEARAEKLDDLHKVASHTQELVNGGMSNQLRLVADALLRVAALTNNPGDVAAAQSAVDRFNQHQEKLTGITASK